jgi:hypothetical protein
MVVVLVAVLSVDDLLLLLQPLLLFVFRLAIATGGVTPMYVTIGCITPGTLRAADGRGSCTAAAHARKSGSNQSNDTHTTSQNGGF